MGRSAHGLGGSCGESSGRIRRTVGQARTRDGADQQDERAGGDLADVLGQGRRRVRVDRGETI